MMIRLLLLLLVLSSVTHQDSVEKTSQNHNVSLLNRDLLDTVPEIIVHQVSTTTRRRILSPGNLKKKRQVQPSSTNFDNGQLKWQTWSGSLPEGAVSFYNEYDQQIYYICQRSCHAGFYKSNMGSYCHFTYDGVGYRAYSFDILVNTDNFEILEWADDSYGSVPQNSVRTCSSAETYVGKNHYGLGKVVPKTRAFYLPWEGTEYWYSYYQVLTINKDVESDHIDNIVYNTRSTNILKYPPETMQVSTVTNNECSTVTQTVTFSKQNRVENRWDISGSLKVSNTVTFSGGIPSIVEAEAQISSEKSFDLSKGYTMTEEVTHSVSVEVKVPPNHQCKLVMIGNKYHLKIPFNSRFSRKYRKGKTTSKSITGMFSSFQVGEFHALVDRCVPVSGPDDCILNMLEDYIDLQL